MNEYLVHIDNKLLLTRQDFFKTFSPQGQRYGVLSYRIVCFQRSVFKRDSRVNRSTVYLYMDLLMLTKNDRSEP